MNHTILIITAFLASIIMPVKLNQPTIVYPTLALKARLEGNVVVVFKVLPDGTTTDHKISKNSNPIFATPALEYSKELKFENKSGDTLLYHQPFVFKLYGNK
jgi:TonB family protein